MKVSVTVQFTADDDPAGDIVIQNLKDAGFEQHINENGYMRLSFDGDVFNNDLAYGGIHVQESAAQRLFVTGTGKAYGNYTHTFLSFPD